ncbi:MAG: hypothetical protein ACRDL3_02260 [Solirubrobacterales bacterium]
MSQDSPASVAYVRYADFLDAHPGRRGDALELGHDWRDGDDRYRVCWYSGTGELTIERLASNAELALEDFHRGVAGPVEVIARFTSRAELERVLGRWPNAAPDQPRTVDALRELARRTPLRRERRS